MGVRIMYCPGCERKLEIKENTELDGMPCPICNEAFLLPAGEEINDTAGKMYRFLRKKDQENRAVESQPKIAWTRLYRNRENFHLGERKN